VSNWNLWRRVAALSVVGAVAAGGIAAGAGSTALAASHHAKKKAKAPWVIGSLIDQTGTDADGGVSQKAGVEWYFKQINAKGGINGHKLKLKFCDTQSTPQGGAQCAQQLAGSVNTHFVLAQSIDPPTRGALPFLTNDLVLAVDPVLLPPKSMTNVFQATGLGKVVAGALVTAAKAAGINTIGVAFTSDTSGQAQLGAVQGVAQAAGIKIVSQSQQVGATDITPQLQQLVAQGAQLIYVASVGTNSSAVVNSYNTLGLNIPIVVGAADVTNGFLGLVSKVPTKMYGVSQLLQDKAALKPRTAKVFGQYLTSFKAATGSPADTQNTSAVYAACEAAAALKGAGPNVTKLESFLNTHLITCLGSNMRFNVPGLNVVGSQPASVSKAGSSAKAGWGPFKRF
jgi:branched-chain amino acid transport system substrate-binding protein